MNSDRQYDRTMELWRSYSIATSLELAAHLENFAILFSYNSGKIEKNDLWGVGMHDVAAPVDEIENDLQQDLDEVSEFGDKNPLVAAAFWHARFEGVHAFADGNGRTGRAMMNYYLLLHNHPPIVIFDEDRKDYYAALDGFDMTGDLKPLIGFLRRETCKTWESAVQREDRSHQMSLKEKRDTVSRRVSLDEINHDFNAR